MKRVLKTLCLSVLVCTLGTACSELAEPITPLSDTEQQTDKVAFTRGSTRVLLSPGTVLSA
jgi:hypothetical protein